MTDIYSSDLEFAWQVHRCRGAEYYLACGICHFDVNGCNNECGSCATVFTDGCREECNHIVSLEVAEHIVALHNNSLPFEKKAEWIAKTLGSK